MTSVFAFIPDPVVVSEIRRVLSPGGRLVLFAGTSELRGTPAAPEPIARRLHFYADEELERLARDVGFIDVQVVDPLDRLRAICLVLPEAVEAGGVGNPVDGKYQTVYLGR